MVNPWLSTMVISEAMFLQDGRKQAANILTHAVQETYERLMLYFVMPRRELQQLCTYLLGWRPWQGSPDCLGHACSGHWFSLTLT